MTQIQNIKLSPGALFTLPLYLLDPAGKQLFDTVQKAKFMKQFKKKKTQKMLQTPLQSFHQVSPSAASSFSVKIRVTAENPTAA